jgi:thiol-disulfide isomerase/thioredoxin
MKGSTLHRPTLAGLLVMILAGATLSQAETIDTEKIDFTGHVQPYQTANNRFAPPAVEFLNDSEQPRTLADYAGQVLIVNFWTSWCPTCLSEMASLQRLQQQLQRSGSPAQVLTLNQDLGDHDQIRQLLRQLKTEQLPAMRDPDGRLGFALGQTLLPTTILIDSQGQVAGQLIGSADWDSPSALALINSLHL